MRSPRFVVAGSVERRGVEVGVAVELSRFCFVDRLADLVPPPRTHRHRYHRVFAAACDAQYDAFSADRVELLARAVILVAGMAISEQMRAAVLARVIVDVE